MGLSKVFGLPRIAMEVATLYWSDVEVEHASLESAEEVLSGLSGSYVRDHGSILIVQSTRL